MGNCCDCGFVSGGPNEVLVKSGCCEPEPFKVAGGRVWVWACCQRIQRLQLNTMTLVVRSEHVYSKYGVPITVTGIAQEIYQDRKKFAKAVFEVASSDFVQMGITVVSYTLKDIRDEEGYLKALGMTRTAQVKKDARIGEAEARKDAGEREARAEEQRLASKFMNEVEIAKAQRDFQLKQAAYDREVYTAKAQSELAYDLQAAKAKQRIREESIQIKVIERAQNIQVQEQEINKGHNGGRSSCSSYSEAEQMMKKADAWKEYQDAAMTDMVLDMLPKVAAEIAAPLATVKKITMVSSVNEDAPETCIINAVIRQLCGALM
ncbi:hypothetical protein LSH36_21g07061 [Paralvinella palmiformis]|uniref:Band 7 domain-containing protein n=1 Tax=Paralvinella palmiformis TaxID=53620 RepID=A0AAD9KBF0_9ANNE|nr:hypothetical protein LSH36_21g07061 [Paralvinella palmiformis]